METAFIDVGEGLFVVVTELTNLIAFAFAWLEQIYFADDRALAVVNALEHLEVAQNLVDVAIPDNRFVSRRQSFSLIRPFNFS